MKCLNNTNANKKSSPSPTGSSARTTGSSATSGVNYISETPPCTPKSPTSQPTPPFLPSLLQRLSSVSETQKCYLQSKSATVAPLNSLTLSGASKAENVRLLSPKVRQGAGFTDARLIRQQYHIPSSQRSAVSSKPSRSSRLDLPSSQSRAT